MICLKKITTIILSAFVFISCSNTIDVNKDSTKKIASFQTNIKSKKFQVAHIGSLDVSRDKDIPHALLIKFNAKKKGFFSSKYQLNDIKFLISNIRGDDKKLKISSISYNENEKKFILELDYDDKNNGIQNGHPLDKNAEDYIFKDNSDRTESYKGDNVIVKKGDVLDFHVMLKGESANKETPEIECKLILY